MLFNSYEFIFGYLPIVFFGFFLIGKRSFQYAALWLASASLFFYGWWNPQFVTLLLASIVFNYSAGYFISKTSQSGLSRNLLICAVAANLLLLGFFKYTNFFIATANSTGADFSLQDIVLPLGVSFFTFTQIAFLVDAHRGIAREYNFIHYLLFVTWFPHLIAGPVLHHKQMIPQFTLPATYRPNAESIAVGLSLFSLGLFKKVILADQFAQYVGPVFDSAANGDDPMLFAAWGAALAYALQLYFDFSGYSDMAIGLSRMFNVKLPINFNSPYKASSIIDFWRRWHMTLSAFLRDYLYIPLGGNRKGVARRQINLLATMLLGGLWHGAGWNFVLWGGMHGIYLIINQAWRSMTSRSGSPKGLASRIISVLITFVAVVIAWVPFRATSMDATISIWYGMAGFNGISLPESIASRISHDFGNGFLMPSGMDTLGNEMLAWLLLGLAAIWLLPNTQQWLAKFAPACDPVMGHSKFIWRPVWQNGLLLGALFGVALVALSRTSEFLYFQF